MLTRIIEEIEQASKLRKPRTERQKLINVIEVGFIWDILSSRYDTLETTKVFIGFVTDTDLRIILQNGEKFLQKEIKRLEDIVMEFGIPSTKKPAANALSIFDTEVVTDEYIYKHILGGIQCFLPTLMIAFTRAISPMFRSLFEEFINEEMKLYSNFLEYGIIKGWINSPPAYRM